MYDVIVVGAGLAGLHTSRLLASRGARVLLIDRKDTLGAPIHTTGIFVRKTWEDFPLPDEQLGPPIRNVFLYSPALRRMHLTAASDEFRIGRMGWLYTSMLEACCRAGVRWLPSTTLVACERGAWSFRAAIEPRRSARDSSSERTARVRSSPVSSDSIAIPSFWSASKKSSPRRRGQRRSTAFSILALRRATSPGSPPTASTPTSVSPVTARASIRRKRSASSAGAWHTSSKDGQLNGGAG